MKQIVAPLSARRKRAPWLQQEVILVSCVDVSLGCACRSGRCLDDVTLESGCLYVIRGSHRQGILDRSRQ